MIISGSANVVTYFYLFFFRAKNIGCEVRRCVRQRREKITDVPPGGILHICLYRYFMTPTKAGCKEAQEVHINFPFSISSHIPI